MNVELKKFWCLLLLYIHIFKVYEHFLLHKHSMQCLSYIISCLLYIIQFAIPQMTQYAVYTTWYCDGQASNFIHICLILIYCLIWICTLSFFSGCWSAIQKLCMHDAYYEVTKSFYCSLFHFQKINLFIQLYFCFQCCS